MAETTLEEAQRCPTCQIPGRFVISQHQRDRSKVDTYTCENERCQYHDIGWLVQILPDGSIPKKGQKGPKAYPQMSAEAESMARAQIEEALWRDPSLRRPDSMQNG